VVLMDAQAAGVPVVSTQHAGIPEVVLDGETGLLVVEGDSAELAVAIDRLLGDPQLRAQLGGRGREHIAEEYNMERQAERLCSIYHEILP